MPFHDGGFFHYLALIAIVLLQTFSCMVHFASQLSLLVLKTQCVRWKQVAIFAV